MRSILSVLGIGALAFFNANVVWADVLPVPPMAVNDPKVQAEEVTRFFNTLNDYRSANALGPLRECHSLKVAAQKHSEAMQALGKLSHDSADGTTPWARFCAAGYKLGCPNQVSPVGTFVSENIAMGNWSAIKTFEQWKGSPGHNSNMLSPKIKVIGIGRASGALPGDYSKHYWTTDFAGAWEPSCEVPN